MNPLPEAYTKILIAPPHISSCPRPLVFPCTCGTARSPCNLSSCTTSSPVPPGADPPPRKSQTKLIWTMTHSRNWDKTTVELRMGKLEKKRSKYSTSCTRCILNPQGQLDSLTFIIICERTMSVSQRENVLAPTAVDIGGKNTQSRNELSQTVPTTDQETTLSTGGPPRKMKVGCE